MAPKPPTTLRPRNSFSAGLRLRWRALNLVIILMGSGLIAGQTDGPPPKSDYLVKAAFLYGFGRMVDWPATAFHNAADPFVIGILGPDPFEGALQEISRKRTIQGRKIVVRHFPAISDFREPCQILFITGTRPREEQREILQQLSRVGLMTVGESPDFTKDGGIANFSIDDNRVRFEINLKAAKRAELRMEAQLLNLGKPAAD
jgi:hypothetical protein